MMTPNNTYKILNKCPKCEKQFIGPRSRPRKYCSKACHDEAQTFSNEQLWNSFVASFHDKYNKNENSCWIWTAYKNKKGYGQLVSFDRKRIMAHRASYLIHKGEIPSDKLVLHNCPSGDNPSCVNPLHLYLGTAIQNTNDMIRKGRHNPVGHRFFGENNGNSKITSDQVIKIKKMLKEKLIATEIAKQMRTTIHTVYDIKRKRTWRHIPD